MKIKKTLCAALIASLLLGSQAFAADESIPDPFAQARAQNAPLGSEALGNTPAPIIIPPAPEFEAESWVMMDYYTGKTICEKNAHKKIWPASLTKMMTSYVIGMEIKAGRLNMDDDVIIPLDAWSKKYSDSSKMFIEVGKTIKVGDLVRGIIIQSGNDACVAMAIHLAGTQEQFVQVMNSYAQKLGLNDTNFSNVHGLFDEMNYSSAHDMAELGRALIRDLPEEYKIYSQKEFKFNGIRQMNRNKLLWDTSLNVDGIKTGHLSEVGYNLVTSATLNNMRLVTAVIGCKSEKLRADYSKALLNYGFRYYEIYTPVTAGKTLLTRSVRMGKTSKVDLVIEKDLAVPIPRGRQNDVKLSYHLNKKSDFIAPISKGDKLGIIEVKVDNKVLSRVPLVSNNDIAEGGFFSTLWDKVCLFFSSDEEDTVEQN